MISVLVSFTLLFTFYFFFSFLVHPLYYCILLVLNSFLCGFICYYVLGISWYSLLLCLVYVGGVYILFIFVSVFSPKVSFTPCFNLRFVLLALLVFFLFLGFICIYVGVTEVEFREYLCTINEGKFYVCMSLFLIFRFVLLSLILGMKFNYYR